MTYHQTTRKTTSLTTNSDLTQGDAVSNISQNLKKKRSVHYWQEQPTTPWETTAQLGTPKPDVQQIPNNLTGEEGEEEEEHEDES